MKKKAVFIDRDGVINETIFRDGKPRAPDRVEEFRFLPGVPEAISRLRDAGYVLVVVTNQPDVSRGWQTRGNVEAMNEIVRTLGVDDIRVCFHDDKDECLCRKPKPGMLLDAAAKFEIDLPRSFMVGDRESDIEAARAAGCLPIFVGRDDRIQCLRVGSLAEAADWILAQP